MSSHNSGAGCCLFVFLLEIVLERLGNMPKNDTEPGSSSAEVWTFWLPLPLMVSTREAGKPNMRDVLIFNQQKWTMAFAAHPGLQKSWEWVSRRWRLSTASSEVHRAPRRPCRSLGGFWQQDPSDFWWLVPWHFLIFLHALCTIMMPLKLWDNARNFSSIYLSFHFSSIINNVGFTIWANEYLNTFLLVFLGWIPLKTTKPISQGYWEAQSNPFHKKTSSLDYHRAFYTYSVNSILDQLNRFRVLFQYLYYWLRIRQ